MTLLKLALKIELFVKMPLDIYPIFVKKKEACARLEGVLLNTTAEDTMGVFPSPR
jgi:hypothetical protein